MNQKGIGCHSAPGYALRSVAAVNTRQKSTLNNPFSCLDNPGHLNSQTGTRREYRLCSGWCSGPMCTGTDQIDLQFDCCLSYISKVYASGAALVMVTTCFGPDQYTEDYVILFPPGGENENTLTEPYSLEQTAIASVSIDESSVVLSNPVHETLTVMVSGESGESWNLDLYDISGRCVMSESGVLHDDHSVLNVGVESLPSGVYMLKTEVGGTEEVRSISVMR